ncbi:MAG: metal ABC transporter permease [Actinomycetota bacterium]|nr:metal ABC transporter permease [Actinomycetota bacterium]
MADFLTYPFLQRALVSGLIIGIACSLIGVFVVLQKMSFFANAIAHSSLAGIALGFLLGINPIVSAVIFGIIIAVLVAYLKNRSTLSVDTIIGIFLPTSMAIGVLIIGLIKGYKPDLLSYLFGNILAVDTFYLYLSLGLGLAVIIILAIFFKPYMFITFDRELAALQGVRVAVYDYLFIIMVAATVIISTKVLGIILVSALIVIPAASSKNISSNFTQMVIFSVLFGFVSSLSGLVLSYVFNLASGATIIMVSAAIFFITLPIKRAVRTN